MGIHYYLCKGYAIDDWENCYLEKIFSDMKSIEQIDMFTVNFKDFKDFRRYLIDNDYIDPTEGIVIGNNKTKNGVKKLRPIFQRAFIFDNDLKMLGINSRTYKEIAKELWKYIKLHQNNEEFMKFILKSYTEKYKDSKAPVASDIFALNRIVNKKEKTNRDKNEYEFSFVNFFRCSIFKCETILSQVSFDGRDTQTLDVFKPIGDEVNSKGLHDMLVHIIEYAGHYEYDYNSLYDGVDKVLNSEVIQQKQEEKVELEVDEENEEFLEDRDFERPLKKYAKEVGLDISDSEALDKDDYAFSIINDQYRLVKKVDGIE